jgi:UPF0716 family protein affecting phage T7 exclusion
MRMGQALRAREPQAAAHSTRLILLVCSAVVAGLAVFDQADAGTLVLAVHWVGVALLLACSVLSPEVLDRLGINMLARRLRGRADLHAERAHRGPSAAAQAFLAFPIFWAASHLRAPGVVLVTAAVLAGNCLTLFLLLPPAAALTDTIFFGAVLVVMAVLLVRAKEKQERGTALKAQVTVDSLTDPATRRAFDGALEKALSRSVPGGTALGLIDVDSFKSINDSLGRPVGDDVLVHLATVLRTRVRDEDAVLSRLGGGRVGHPDARVPQGRGGAPGGKPAAGGPLVAHAPGRRHFAGPVDQRRRGLPPPALQ